jgi:uncharacterized phage protein (TIGR02220 family)
MIEYLVLKGMNVELLTTTVKEHVNKGYTLQGGMCPVCTPTGVWAFYQTVTKKERKPRKIDTSPEVESVLNYFELRSGKKYSQSETNAKSILARLSEGHSVTDLYRVIDNQTTKWLGDDKMEQYLRPQTIFGKEKFEGYLNSVPKAQAKFQR